MIPIAECPRCGVLSVYSDDDGDYCTTCGFFADEMSRCDLPHFGYSYRWRNDPTKLEDPSVGREPNIADLESVEAWLRERETKGIEFTSFVVVDIEGEVHWLRGNPPKPSS
jgi:ribosomal protein L37E